MVQSGNALSVLYPRSAVGFSLEAPDRECQHVGMGNHCIRFVEFGQGETGTYISSDFMRNMMLSCFLLAGGFKYVVFFNHTGV